MTVGPVWPMAAMAAMSAMQSRQKAPSQARICNASSRAERTPCPQNRVLVVAAGQPPPPAPLGKHGGRDPVNDVVLIHHHRALSQVPESRKAG